MKEVNNDKRVLKVEIDNNVKKMAITGFDKDAQVVMKQELSDDELDDVAGGRDQDELRRKDICNRKRQCKKNIY